MKVIFLTEMGFEGKVPSDHANMRTEFAWMNALKADHSRIYNYKKVIDYDHVFIIFPKGNVYLNAFAAKLSNEENPISHLLSIDFVTHLKNNNKKVHFIQEGPHWLWNDYEIHDQINYYNMVLSCDTILCHNESDSLYYKGLYENKSVHVINTLMIEDLVKHISPVKEDKTIIGGNFARWYGGFESYMIASEFKTDIYVQESHAKRNNEDSIPNLTHLPRLLWIDWMKTLSTFKYAVHLMPTVAAGTFSLNCAYFGIPCIGNKNVDTQKNCHPNLSVEVNDLDSSKKLARMLVNDSDFYEQCSKDAKNNYNKYYGIDKFLQQILKNIQS